MKKALVDTQTSNIQYIASWAETPNKTPKQYSPIYETYSNSNRICEVTDTPFEVYPTLIWVDCDDDVIADQYYFDAESKSIKKIIDAPYPTEE